MDTGRWLGFCCIVVSLRLCILHHYNRHSLRSAVLQTGEAIVHTIRLPSKHLMGSAMLFGKSPCPFCQVEDKGDSACCSCNCLGNCLWFIPGLIIAIFNILSAVVCFITIIGIPFGIQFCKLARLAFSPFGLEVTADKIVAVGRI